MKTNHPHTLAALTIALALAGASSLKANLFDFTVNLNTAGLVGAANAPFYLDFQLNEGSSTVPNAVTLSDFTFTGGAATGTPQLFGDAAGSLGGMVTLADSAASPFGNEFLQEFTDGTTEIHFDVAVSENTPGTTPDKFAVAVLDSEADLPQIPTTAPDGISLLTLDLGAADTSRNIQVYESVSPLVSASVPDAASTALLFVGAGTILMGFRRFGAQGA